MLRAVPVAVFLVLEVASTMLPGWVVAADVPTVKATVTSPSVPTLIRNTQGPLLHLTIQVPQGATSSVTAFRFSLVGADEIESLSLYRSPETVEFHWLRPEPWFQSKDQFGKPSPPADAIAVTSSAELAAGDHHFWLTCRLKPAADLLQHVAATCTGVETSAGEIIPQPSGGTAAHRIGVALRRHGDDGVHTSRIPALGTSSKGTLLCVYDLRRQEGRDLQEDIDIGLSRSIDGGQTWEPARVIMDLGEYGGLPQSQNGCSDPGLLIDSATGEIFCFAVWMHGKPGKHQWTDDGSEPGFEIGKTAQLMVVRSRDDGLTWSAPENLTRTLKQESWWLLAPAPQQGIILPNGTLVMPMQGRTGRDALATFATIMTSSDHGRTWVMGQPAVTGGNECQAAMLGDGTMMLNVRNDRERFRAVAITRDLGQTWQPHVTSGNVLIEPNCNGSLRRIDYQQEGQSRHVLLFANPHTQKGRTHHSLQVSFDDGKTWPASHRILLDEGTGAGYPSITQIDADHVGIVYEGSQAHLAFQKFTVQELLEPPAQ